MFTYPWGINEDDLTGDFFGLMKYLPSEALLMPFLNLVHSLYPDRNIKSESLEEAEILLWPTYEIPKEWREQFNRPDIPVERRCSKYYIVPDVVIHLSDVTFIVEAEKSHSVEAEQLFQQYLIGRRQFLTSRRNNHKLFNMLVNIDQIRPYFCNIRATDKQTGVLISPSDSIPQYIHKRAKMLGETFSVDEIARSFLWISWHHIGRLAEELVDRHKRKADELSRFISKFLLGLKEMMDSEGLYPVRIFRAGDPNEVVVKDCVSIPVSSVLPNCKDLSPSIDPQSIPLLLSGKSSLTWDTSEFVGAIHPSCIPAFQLLPDLTKYLLQTFVQPTNIKVLSQGGY